MPPPGPVAELPDSVLLMIVRVAPELIESALRMPPPPKSPAELPDSVLLIIVSLQVFSTPPPPPAVLPDRVLLMNVSTPPRKSGSASQLGTLNMPPPPP